MSNNDKNFELLQCSRFNRAFTRQLAGSWRREGDVAVAEFGDIEDAAGFVYYLKVHEALSRDNFLQVQIDRHYEKSKGGLAIPSTVKISLGWLETAKLEAIIKEEEMELGPIRNTQKQDPNFPIAQS